MARHSPRTTTTPSAHGADKHTNVTRELYLPAIGGNIYAGSPANVLLHSCVRGGANSDEPIIYLTMKVPDDFVSFTSVKALWASAATAKNMYWKLQAAYATEGEILDHHVEIPAYGATATGGLYIANVQEPANPLTLANLASGDYLGIGFYRNGVNALDTLNSEVSLIGLLFTYVAEQ